MVRSIVLGPLSWHYWVQMRWLEETSNPLPAWAWLHSHSSTAKGCDPNDLLTETQRKDICITLPIPRADRNAWRHHLKILAPSEIQSNLWELRANGRCLRWEKKNLNSLILSFHSCGIDTFLAKNPPSFSRMVIPRRWPVFAQVMNVPANTIWFTCKISHLKQRTQSCLDAAIFIFPVE